MRSWLILKHQKNGGFGDFKKKFEKFNICSYFYSVVILEKFLSSTVIILFRNVSFGLIFEVIIICSQLAFVAIKNPYICGDYLRPLLNLSIAVFCIILIFLNFLMFFLYWHINKKNRSDIIFRKYKIRSDQDRNKVRSIF